MVNEIRKIPYSVTPPTRSGNDGGSAAEPPPTSSPETVKKTQAAPQDLAVPVAPERQDARLVIEKSNLTGGFVYKSVDRKTGKVIKQFPREDVLRALAAVQATEGQIIDTEA